MSSAISPSARACALHGLEELVIDMAREVEAEGSKKDFDRAFRAVVKEKPQAKVKDKG
jgi:hypothetical protein